MPFLEAQNSAILARGRSHAVKIPASLVGRRAPLVTTARSCCFWRRQADDYVGSGNPIRFIDPFFDGLDLAVAGFGRFVAIHRLQGLRSLKLEVKPSAQGTCRSMPAHAIRFRQCWT